MHWDQRQELWLPIKDYEGLYEVSNMGRVKSLKYGKERILRSTDRGNGYLFVTLHKDRKGKHHFIHRLVAEAFLDNPYNLPEVNHKDENPSNNRVENLEWCDRRYNVDYSLAKPILQLTLDGELVQEWPSVREAERQGGFDHRCISKCCLGKYKKHGGYIWRFKTVVSS